MTQEQERESKSFMMRAAVLLIGLVGCALGVPGQDTRPVYSEDEILAFDFVEQLGAPDTSALPCVIVRTVLNKRGLEQLGFVMSEDADGLNVWCLDFDSRKIQRNADVTLQAVGTFADMVPIWRDRLKTRTDSRPVSATSELISLGRACALRKMPTLSQSCCEAARVRGPRYGREASDRHLLRSIRIDMDYALMWRAVLNCGDRQATREEMLGRFVDYQRLFPTGLHFDGAAEMGRELRRMVQEEHDVGYEPRLADVDLETASVEELIFRLRDERGHQFTSPGHATIGRRGPAARLVQIGIPAVPRLIDAIGDRRLTRTVASWRDATFSHYVLRVGDCAVQILERIAGKQFWDSGGRFAYPLKDGGEDGVRERVNEWWNALSKPSLAK
jgi:hypothetical protein